MKIDFYSPAAVFTPPSYSQVVSVSGGRTIHVSGQVAFNAKGEVVGKGDLRAQVRQVYENLAATLAAAGATLDHVAKVNTYVVGLDPVTAAAIREARAPFMPKSHVPASTMVGTPALIHPDLLLEVEVIACVDAAPG
jgi:enamine deaminase RidA (YjgF/YER057c/UK114 family)